MTFSLRSSSTSFNNAERLKRKRLTISTLNRYSSFNENKSSAAENRRRSLQSTPYLIELLEEDEDDIDHTKGVCHECNTCSKLFASEYGVNHHINMHHPNQSILCSHCHITFGSHRSLKTHQQRRHSLTQSRLNIKDASLPNYCYLSSYLVLPFSTKQFPIMAKNACEQNRLPMGVLSSKLFLCNFCHISFPCSRSLQYHLLNKHEQYEYQNCEKVLCDIIAQVEFNLRTVNDNDNDNDDDIESIRLNLAKQASNFGLINKQLRKKLHSAKKEQNRSIYPVCQHENRTCANLCLKYLSSYSNLVATYPYTITKNPKGSAFNQGSIVSVPASGNNIYSNDVSSPHDSNTSNETSSGRQKRKSIKQVDVSLSSPSKKKGTSTVTIANSKLNRVNSNNKSNIKQQTDKTSKNNDLKPTLAQQSSATITTTSTSPRKILPKENYTRCSSMSSNSLTSTRSLTAKSSTSSTHLTQPTMSSQRASKRNLSPSIAISSEKTLQKRHQTRQQRQNMILSLYTTTIKVADNHENGIEQENGDDDDDVVPIEVEPTKQSRQTKQRRASESSIEYVQTLNIDQQSASSSLNNIENIKLTTKVNDEEIIICRSPPSTRKMISSLHKNHARSSMNGNSSRKSNIRQPSNNDEHVRVRCKICGEILEGRSRFSQHVVNMHSHLLNKNINESKQQQTAIVR